MAKGSGTAGRNAAARGGVPGGAPGGDFWDELWETTAEEMDIPKFQGRGAVLAALENAGFEDIQMRGTHLVGTRPNGFDEGFLTADLDTRSLNWHISGSENIEGELFTDVSYTGKGVQGLIAEFE